MLLRQLLHPGPRATRFFVIALALLQLVAPTWHVCALGGHLAAHSKMAHHGALRVAAGAPNRPLICFCAPHQKPLDPQTPRLDGVLSANHATCLALLLQTMPGQTGAPPPIFESRALVPADFKIEVRSAPCLTAPRRSRGRAPPGKC